MSRLSERVANSGCPEHGPADADAGCEGGQEPRGRHARAAAAAGDPHFGGGGGGNDDVIECQFVVLRGRGGEEEAQQVSERASLQNCPAHAD